MGRVYHFNRTTATCVRKPSPGLLSPSGAVSHACMSAIGSTLNSTVATGSWCRGDWAGYH